MAPVELVTRTQKNGCSLRGWASGFWSTTAYQNLMVLCAGATMNVFDNSSQPLPLTAFPIRTAPTEEPGALVGKLNVGETSAASDRIGSGPVFTQVWWA